MEKCRLGPVREWLQPGIGHGSRSIIWIVVSRGGGHSGGRNGWGIVVVVDSSLGHSACLEL